MLRTASALKRIEVRWAPQNAEKAETSERKQEAGSYGLRLLL